MATKKQIEKLTKLSLKELRELYTNLLGETTRAPNKVYLARKILEARAQASTSNTSPKPTKPWKPAKPTKTTANKPDQDFMVLPFRIPRDHVVQLDDTWRMLGYKSRSQFFRAALCRLLNSEGQDETAELFE